MEPTPAYDAILGPRRNGEREAGGTVAFGARVARIKSGYAVASESGTP
jgi:hypothetical protein